MQRMSPGKESVIESVTLVHSVVREVMGLELTLWFRTNSVV